jgi:Reverse transcriptase (RNA-dependent DNA polymerase)
LANRFQSVLQRIIDRNQTAFLQFRVIIYGVITTHELLYSVKLSNEKGILLKLDFQKVFDSVNWGYILHMLQARGFSELSVQWIS